MESVTLKVTSAFVLAGEIARAGELVEVSVTEAKSLLARGKAVLATEADASKVKRAPLAVGPTKQADEGEVTDKEAAEIEAVEAAKADEQPQPKPAKRRGK